VVARLNAALNRPTDADVPLPTAPPTEQSGLADEEVLRWLAETSPELKVLDHEIEGTRHAIALARKDYFPDITLGVDYTDVGSPLRSDALGLANPGALRSVSRLGGGMGDLIDVYSIGRSFRQGSQPSDASQDVWMVSLSMNVPIWYSKYAAGVREARARYLAAAGARAQLENTLTAVTQRVLYEYRDAERKIELYRGTLIPKARESIRSTERAFRAGNGSFLDLVDAERSLLEFELSYERALANRSQRLAELDKLVGRPIPRIPPPTGGPTTAPVRDEEAHTETRPS
jgi:outer membrane protein TolC